jgi:hypothetical protein
VEAKAALEDLRGESSKVRWWAGNVARVAEDVPPDPGGACVARSRTTYVFGGASSRPQSRADARFTGSP